MKKQSSFFRRHSLSIVSSIILLCWIVLYIHSDPNTHWGSFFGNAIADWTGLVVTVLGTKFMYERGSAEPEAATSLVGSYLGATAGTLAQYFLSHYRGGMDLGVCRAEPNSKWGQVVGNIVSEWTQIFGLVILTKKLIESHSKESR